MSEDAKQRVYAKFMQKLAAKHPDSPWVKNYPQDWHESVDDRKPSGFEAIYWPNATCGIWDGTADCHQPGVVLAYDVFSPEVGIWFCTEHWPEYEEIMSIVEDRREKEAQHEHK